MTSTQAPHPIALTAAGKRLADALPPEAELADIIREAVSSHNDVDGVFWAGVAREVAQAVAAAEILMPAEGAGLREALKKIAWECDPADPEWSDPASGRAHCFQIASTALASPQSAVEGPVAAGVDLLGGILEIVCRQLHDSLGDEDADSLMHPDLRNGLRRPNMKRWEQWLTTAAPLLMELHGLGRVVLLPAELAEIKRHADGDFGPEIAQADPSESATAGMAPQPAQQQQGKAPDAPRLIAAEMEPAQMERMAFNLSAQFGPGFVEDHKAFALAVYAEAYAIGRPATLTHPADLKPTVPGNDAGMREPITAIALADALECFWNAAIGAERADSSPAGCIAEGFQAIAVRLREGAALSTALDEVGPLAEIAAERRRQIEAEGWTLGHDDTHSAGEMAKAAAAYAIAGSMQNDFLRENFLGEWDHGKFSTVRSQWPSGWDWSWFKPTMPRRDLVKAGALIVAEIERLDRASGALPLTPQTGSAGEDPKTPDAGVGERCPNPDRYDRGECCGGHCPAPVGEDETGVGGRVLPFQEMQTEPTPPEEARRLLVLHAKTTLADVLLKYAPQFNYDNAATADALTEASTIVDAALSAAPAARPGDGVEALPEIAEDAVEILPLVAETLKEFRGEDDEVLDDLINRFRGALAAAPAADGGRA